VDNVALLAEMWMISDVRRDCHDFCARICCNVRSAHQEFCHILERFCVHETQMFSQQSILHASQFLLAMLLSLDSDNLISPRVEKFNWDVNNFMHQRSFR
jgi:hypothetical protein